MCCYKTIHNNENGYVVKCNKCRHLHVGFGNTVLAFTHDQFDEFVETIESAFEMNKHSFQREVKRIQIPTVVRSIMLIYSVNELENFASLLTSAKKQIDNEKLFVFHDN